ncbi:hypothetical protein LQ318_11625 [Aliifodinibius salicampi]|uniref:Uncharacterized protein n=1 Tax=Fodinibius salicampi TaxID=1920655 RepID=A0ABT3Q0B3_9BACT|nr:hypothetical protein [Fodinibius salicampi]MCW9713550.1 hypothetical protein [Fodinibius salicampi]
MKRIFFTFFLISVVAISSSVFAQSSDELSTNGDNIKKTKVLVLATHHIINHEDNFSPTLVDSLINVLEDYSPTII